MLKYARANNKYMESYGPKKDLSYITYFEKNNLNGWPTITRKLFETNSSFHVKLRSTEKV